MQADTDEAQDCDGDTGNGVPPNLRWKQRRSETVDGAATASADSVERTSAFLRVAAADECPPDSTTAIENAQRQLSFGGVVRPAPSFASPTTTHHQQLLRALLQVDQTSSPFIGASNSSILQSHLFETSLLYNLLRGAQPITERPADQQASHVSLAEWEGQRVLARPPGSTSSSFVPGAIRFMQDGSRVVLCVKFDDDQRAPALFDAGTPLEIIGDQPPSLGEVHIGMHVVAKRATAAEYRPASIVGITMRPSISFQVSFGANGKMGEPDGLEWVPRAHVRLLRPPWQDELNAVTRPKSANGSCPPSSMHFVPPAPSQQMWAANQVQPSLTPGGPAPPSSTYRPLSRPTGGSAVAGANEQRRRFDTVKDECCARNDDERVELHVAGETSDASMHRKRRHTDSGQCERALKLETMCSPMSDEGLYETGDVSRQCIRFDDLERTQCHALFDANGRSLPKPQLYVIADKGFNYSTFDGAFVNQKKNHFQVTVHIELRDGVEQKYIQTPNDGGVLKPIVEFQLDFYGLKAETLGSSVQILQSQTDRKPVNYEPLKLELPPSRTTKVTVARLHFSETTMNNQRKNGHPNPEQKFFVLVCSLNAVVDGGGKYTIVAHASEQLIVRASNPGQFEKNVEPEVHWQKGQTQNSIFHSGSVGIGIDRPLATLTVAGDISYTGNLYHPSDRRLKDNIRELNGAEALSRMSQLRFVHYRIRPEMTTQLGLHTTDRVGVIAQEISEIIPDAVSDDGSGYLQVDESRIFFENVAAVKELARLTSDLSERMDHVESARKKKVRQQHGNVQTSNWQPTVDRQRRDHDSAQVTSTKNNGTQKNTSLSTAVKQSFWRTRIYETLIIAVPVVGFLLWSSLS